MDNNSLSQHTWSGRKQSRTILYSMRTWVATWVTDLLSFHLSCHMKLHF